jgi:hypothetical protein
VEGESRKVGLNSLTGFYSPRNALPDQLDCGEITRLESRQATSPTGVFSVSSQATPQQLQAVLGSCQAAAELIPLRFDETPTATMGSAPSSLATQCELGHSTPRSTRLPCCTCPMEGEVLADSGGDVTGLNPVHRHIQSGLGGASPPRVQHGGGSVVQGTAGVAHTFSGFHAGTLTIQHWLPKL